MRHHDLVSDECVWNVGSMTILFVICNIIFSVSEKIQDHLEATKTNSEIEELVSYAFVILTWFNKFTMQDKLFS